MENGVNTGLKPHKLNRKSSLGTIHVDFGDHSILKVYRKALKAPMRTVMHHLIGVACRCLEEKHLFRVSEVGLVRLKPRSLALQTQ